MKTLRHFLKSFLLIGIVFSFYQCTQEAKNEFSFDNSEGIERISNLMGTSSEMKSLTSENKEYDFDSVLYKTFRMAKCKLPKKIARKIKDDGGLLPPRVDEFFYTDRSIFPPKVYRLPGKGVEYILHVVNVQKARQNGKETIEYRHKDYGLDFEGFVLSEFIAEKSSNLFYSLDCQGYFNAALAVHGGFSMFSNIKSEASTNMGNKTTIMIGYASVINPFARAYFNNFPGVKKLKPTERLKILKKLESIENLEETDTITYITAYNCLFTTKNSESNLNGDVSLDVEVKTPPVNVESSTGFELSKSIKFEAYDTYYVKDEFFTGREMFSVKELKEKIIELESQVQNENNSSVIEVASR